MHPHFSPVLLRVETKKKKKRHSLVECRIENLLGVGDKRRKREESRKAEEVPKRRPTAGSGS